MPNFKVITSAVVATAYTIVGAKNKTDAEAKFWNGDFTIVEELSDYEIDSQEEVLEIKKLK